MPRSLPQKSSLEDIDVDRLLRTLFSDDWVFKTGVGGMLVAASIVVALYSYMCIPLAVALWAVLIGYSLRCMRFKLLNADCKLPDWNDWGDLFVSGMTWVATQFSIWFMIIAVVAGIMFLACMFATGASSDILTQAELLAASLLIACLWFFFSLLSAFLMVYFAQQENTASGWAFVKVFKRIRKHPSKFISAYLLALGIQWASIIVPCITVIGVFLLPSLYFLGQTASSAVLARAWSSTADDPI